MRTNSRLLVLVLAAWIPSLMAVTWLARWAYVHEVERGAESLQHLGDSLKSVLERELDKRAVLAQTLAAAAEHHGADPRQFHEEATAAAWDSRSWTILLDRQLLLASTRLAVAHRATPRTTRSFVTGPPALFFYRSGSFSERPMLVMLARAPGVKAPRVNVGTIFEPAAIQAMLERFDYPQGVAATVLDRDHFVVAASAHGNDMLGTPAREDVLQRVSTGEHGLAQFTAENGVQFASYLAGTDRYGWNVVMDAPTSAFTVRAREVFLPLLGAGGVLLLVALSTSLYAVRRVRAPGIRNLAATDAPELPQYGQPQPVDLERIMLKNQRFARKVFGSRFELKAYVQSNLPPVLLDPVLLEQAMLNLVFNARRSLGDGGLIVMVARVARTHETSTNTRGRSVCLEVSEEEASEEVATNRPKTQQKTHQRAQSRVPMRSHRPDPADEADGSANGLGVAQVVALIRQWGGDVQFHRLSGQPVRTCLILPVADPPEFAPATRKVAA